MTATEVFLRFLKEELEYDEFLFFMHYLHDHGNGYFYNRKYKRKLFSKTFVEDYLSRNNRSLFCFMKRLFILAPNLKRYCSENKRYNKLKVDWILERRKRGTEKRVFFCEKYHVAMYVMYYNRKWQNFLKGKIDKKNSYSIYKHFRKGEETPNFKVNLI